MKELIKDAVGKFAMPILATACIAFGGMFYESMQSIGLLDTRLVHVEDQIARHEKALDRDFARHEKTVMELSHKTDDQEKRLTRLEALITQTQELLNEIRSDVKSLLRGAPSMSFFKEQLELDINNVFLNLNEFAEELNIDGVIRKAMIDDSQGGFSVSPRDSLDNPSGIGLVENGRVLYLEDNFEERPVPGQILEIDGEKWLVNDDPASVKIEMGILVLHISREWS